jgi:hypothetical protein
MMLIGAFSPTVRVGAQPWVPEHHLLRSAPHGGDGGRDRSLGLRDHGNELDLEAVSSVEQPIDTDARARPKVPREHLLLHLFEDGNECTVAASTSSGS